MACELLLTYTMSIYAVSACAVLTAAHCCYSDSTDNRKFYMYYIVVGAYKTVPIGIQNVAAGPAPLPNGAIAITAEHCFVKPDFRSTYDPTDMPFDGSEYKFLQLDICILLLKDPPQLPVTGSHIAHIGEIRHVEVPATKA